MQVNTIIAKKFALIETVEYYTGLNINILVNINMRTMFTTVFLNLLIGAL